MWRHQAAKHTSTLFLPLQKCSWRRRSPRPPPCFRPSGRTLQRRTTTTDANSSSPSVSPNPAPTNGSSMKRPGRLSDDLFLDATLSRHGVRLTQTELVSLRNFLDLNKDGRVSTAELQKAGKEALQRRWIRELCLTVIEKPQSKYEHFTSRLLGILDYSGTALFACAGTQLAGEQDMNLIGCVLVGCITALGGGTLNNILYGSSALLLDRPGVFWVRIPAYLGVAMMASVLTFFAWPVVCRQLAKQELEQGIGQDNVDHDDDSVGRRAFMEACQRDPDFAKSMAEAFGMDADKVSPHELFMAATAQTKSARIDLTEMGALVAKKVDGSSTMYILDTLAQAAFTVTAVNGAVQRGLHPIVAATCGVTMCFGGIVRDVLCGRDLAIGGQSYAFVTGVGSAVYVLLRELQLQGLPFPLLFRIICAFGTTIGLRTWEFLQGEPLLRPMHYHHDDDSRLLQSLNHHSTQASLEDIGRKAE